MAEREEPKLGGELVIIAGRLYRVPDVADAAFARRHADELRGLSPAELLPFGFYPDTPLTTFDPLSDPLNDPFPEELR